MKDIKTIRDLFDYLNKECDYLVLRNWDDIFDESIYGSGHEDIDILCRNLESFIALTNATRVHSSSYRDNFVVSIGNMKVRFDVRHVGDGYYPSDWESEMLDNKVKTDQDIYIMNTEDYVYSLSYHALIQKPFLSDEYRRKIIKAYNLLEIKNSDLQLSDFLTLLRTFCSRKGYRLEIPSDPGVYLNSENMRGFDCVFNVTRSRRRVTLRVKQAFNYYYSTIKSKLICRK